MRIYPIIAVALAAIAPQASAQTIGDVLRSIEQNNITLQSMLKANEAEGLAMGADNTLEAPSVEYSPFFSGNTSGVASSELVVSQGFDFPTAYAARGKANRLEREALHRQYLTARRDLLLSAKLLCIDLAYQQRRIDIAHKRNANAEALLKVVEKRMAEGDATAIELGKVRIDRMGAATEAAQAEADAAETLSSLQALNGGLPLQCHDMAYPDMPTESYDALAQRAATADHGVMEAQATLDAKAQQVKVSGQEWLPKLEVGYRRNTEMGEAVNGFLVGASFPIYGTAKRVRAAKAQRESATLALDEAKLQAATRANALAERLKRQRTVLDAYDTALMDSTLQLLRQAVEEGEMSIAEYYAEADGIYASMLDQCELMRQHHQTLAELTRDDL